MQYTAERYRGMDQALFSDCAEREAFFRLLKEHGQTLSPQIQGSFKTGMGVGAVSGFYIASFLGFGMKAIAVNSDAQALTILKKERFILRMSIAGLAKMCN